VVADVKHLGPASPGPLLELAQVAAGVDPALLARGKTSPLASSSLNGRSSVKKAGLVPLTTMTSKKFRQLG
jgi:hypothetical protein